jgi:hypothetical protein
VPGAGDSIDAAIATLTFAIIRYRADRDLRAYSFILVRFVRSRSPLKHQDRPVDDEQVSASSIRCHDGNGCDAAFGLLD